MFDSQRAGIAIVLVFLVLGAILLTSVDEEQGMKSANRNK
jgi:MFS-type transporter involved in bile tolerance (Atg22 family)